MFPSINLGSVFDGDRQYTQTRLHTIMDSKTTISNIKLNFSQINTGKKSSFLPEMWSETQFQSHWNKHAYIGSTVFKLNEKDTEKLETKKFSTGSRYVGDFNQLGMAGKGIYKFPHGVIYDGNFNKNGEFHGTGTLVYPGGQRVEGFWRDGKLMKGANFISNNNVAFHSELCKIPDRRFQIEVENDITPAGLEYLTKDPRPQQIPKGCYDMGEGFYDPKRRIIIDYQNPSKHKTIFEICEEEKLSIYTTLLKMTKSTQNLLDDFFTRFPTRPSRIKAAPADEMEQWIKDNCRKAWDEPVQFRKDLYETWTAGYKTDKYQEIGILMCQSTDLVDKVIRRNVEKRYSTERKYTYLYSFIKNKKSKFKRVRWPSILSELANMLRLLTQYKELPSQMRKTKLPSRKSILLLRRTKLSPKRSLPLPNIGRSN